MKSISVFLIMMLLAVMLLEAITPLNVEAYYITYDKPYVERDKVDEGIIHLQPPSAGGTGGSVGTLQQVTDAGNTTTNAIETGTVTATDVIVPNWQLGTATYSTLNDFFKLFNSAGRISGGAVTDGGGETVNVTTGQGVIRVADDDISQVKFIHWEAQAGIAIPTDTTRYIGIDYNIATEAITIVTEADEYDFDLDTEFPLAQVVNENGGIHVLNNPWWVSDGLTNIIQRLQADGHIVRDTHYGGLMLSVSPIRHVAVTEGVLWSRLTEFLIPALDTDVAGDVEIYWYQSGTGIWTDTHETQYPVTHWNDITTPSLQTLNNNWYANFWVYAEAGDDEIALIYPQAQYSNSASAEAEAPPTDLPAHILEEGILIGRILFKEGVDAPVEVQSSFSTIFNPAQATDHGNLAGLGDDDHFQYRAFNKLIAESGSTTANANPDTLTISGTGVATSITDDTLHLSLEDTDYSVVLSPSGGIVPTSDGAEQTKVDGTNFPYYVLDFDPTADEFVYWQFQIPPTYTGGNITPTIYWSGTPTANDVVWAIQVGGAEDSEQYDKALGGAETVTTTIDGVSEDINTSTISAFDPSWSAGDIVTIKIYRDANNGSDDMAGDARYIMGNIKWPSER